MVIPVDEMIVMIEQASEDLRKTQTEVKKAVATAMELRKDFDDLVECTYARLMTHNPLTGQDHTDLKDLVSRLRKKWELSE